MKKLVEQIKLWEFLVGIVVTFVITMWMVFVAYDDFMTELKSIQKTTLRNTIWNESIPMHDRLESCDHYIELGFNSETKKYCNDLLERDE